jgi:hypothetical protein
MRPALFVSIGIGSFTSSASADPMSQVFRGRRKWRRARFRRNDENRGCILGCCSCSFGVTKFNT